MAPSESEYQGNISIKLLQVPAQWSRSSSLDGGRLSNQRRIRYDCPAAPLCPMSITERGDPAQGI